MTAVPPLCHRERAEAVMRREGLDALVAAEARNVHYLSNFDANLLWNWPWVAFAIYPLDPARPPTLVCPALDLPTLIHNPTWMPEVRTYTLKASGGDVTPADIKPLVREGVPLGDYERQALRLFETTPNLSAPAPEVLLAEVLASLGLTSASLGMDDLRLAQRLAGGSLPGIRVLDTRDLMREIRLVKTPAEIERMRGAAVRNEVALGAAIAATSVGATWDEIVAAYRIEMIRQGGTPRYLIRGAGELAGVRVQIGDHPIREGDLVFYDALGQYRHYHGDIGRTAFVGEAPTEVRRYQEAMRVGWHAAVERIRPGMTSHELGALVRDSVRKAGFPAYSVATPHSLGLEHFDHPQQHGFYQEFVIEAGCVLNVDMPFVELGWGSMHLEDTVVVRDGGVELLTSNDTRLIEIPT